MAVLAAKPAPLRKTVERLHSLSRYKLALGLLLAAFTLAVFNPVAGNGFVNFDDDRYVLENSHVREGVHLGTVSWAFTSLEQANWHPLTWLSHALDYQLFHQNPAGHHYTSVLLHTANALLLFLILQWFTGYIGRSLMVAALFAVHPLNVESVAWVAERKNVLCMLFFLLAISGYGWYVRRPGIGRYIVVAILFTMSLMSKPMAITLPAVLLLLDYWPLGRMRFRTTTGEDKNFSARFAASSAPLWKLFVEKLPLVALSTGSAIVTVIAQRKGGAVLSSAARAPMLRVENAVLSYAIYVRKAIWPSHLAVLYPYPHALSPWRVAGATLSIAIVTCIVLRYRAHRYLLVGWLWCLLTLVPMIGLVQVGNQAMADRYAYLPSIGLFIMAVWSVTELVGNRVSRICMATAGLSVVLALAAVTRIQIRYWHDDLSLWAHALAVTQNNYVAENNLAEALMRQGRSDEGIVHFRTASALEPDDPVSELNVGIYAQEHGDPGQAKTRYELVLQLATDPDLRASAYANLGTVYFSRHDFDRAQENFEAALKLKRRFPIALLDMGLMAQKGAEKSGSEAEWGRAAEDFSQLIAIDPSDVGYLLLANALRQSGHLDEAKVAYQKALQLSSDIAQTQQRAARLAGP